MQSRERAIPVPVSVVATVEDYVERELADAKQYTNRSPLDESGIWTLHRLAAAIYQMGFDDGLTVQAERSHHSRLREREAEKSDPD